MAGELVVVDDEAADHRTELGHQSCIAVGDDLVVDDLSAAVAALEPDGEVLDAGQAVVDTDDGEAFPGRTDLNAGRVVGDLHRSEGAAAPIGLAEATPPAMVELP